MAKKTPYTFPERKTRSIEEISKRYQAAKAIATRLQETRWMPWYNEGDKLKIFWGYIMIDNKRIKSVYSFSDHGYSHNYIGNGYSHDEKLIAQVANPKELPLMLNDPKYEKNRNYIVAILKGDLPSAVKRQDLVDEHCYLEARHKHIYRVKNSYLKILKSYIYDKFHNRIYDRYQSPILIITIGEHTYHFNCDREIKLIEDIEYYTVQPEEAIKTPYRLDVN